MPLPLTVLRAIASRHLPTLISYGYLYPRGVPLINAVRSRFRLSTTREAQALINAGIDLLTASRAARDQPHDQPIGRADLPTNREYFERNLIPDRYAYRVQVEVAGRYRGDEPQVFELDVGSDRLLSQNEIAEEARLEAIRQSATSPKAAEAVFQPASQTVRYTVLFGYKQY